MNNQEPSLGIIIVNYNSGILLNKCVTSIFENTSLNKINLTVVVVDNASKDDSTNINPHPNLIIIHNNVNLGFGKACNQGVEILGEMDYILFLNPDTMIHPKVLEKSIHFLKNSNDVSILGVKHEDEYQIIKASCSREPTTRRIISDIFGLSKLMPKVFKPATVMSDFDHKTSRFVDQVMGAYMLMGKNVVDEISGFDERFFVYYEDADFALRARKKGYKSYYNSELKITHIGRGTTEKISDKSLFFNLRSRYQFILKHEGRINATIVLCLTLTIEFVMRLIYNVLKNPKENINTIKAYNLLYRNVLKIT